MCVFAVSVLSLLPPRRRAIEFYYDLPSFIVSPGFNDLPVFSYGSEGVLPSWVFR